MFASLTVWECVEYAALATVFLGVVGEYLAEFKNFPKDAVRRKIFEKRSTLVLIVGLAFELLGTVRTTQIGNREIAELNARAEDARKTTAQLEAAVQPRTLTVEQQRQLTLRWQGLAGSKILVMSYLVDTESYRLCTQLASTFVTAKLDVATSCGTLMARPPLVFGVQMVGTAADDALIKAVSESLRDPGNLETVPAFVATDTSQDRPVLLVGIKPFAVIK